MKNWALKLLQPLLLSNKSFLLVLILLINVQHLYSQNNNINRTLNTVLTHSSFKNASIGVYVYNLTADSAIVKHNEYQSLTPASTLKALTTAAALQRLGSYYRFKTALAYDGHIDTNTNILHGDLYIKGGGDPTLGSKYFTKKGDEKTAFLAKWVETIKEAKIDSITGRIIADDSYFSDFNVPTTWVWGDMGNYYGAPPNGLTVYDNLCEYSFNSGERAGDSTEIVCISPYTAGLNIQNRVKAANIKSDNAYIYGAPYSNQWWLLGSIPKAKENFVVKGVIPDPAYTLALDFRIALAEEGINCTENANTTRLIKLQGDTVASKLNDIYTHKSPVLATIARLTNVYSINLYAEHLLNMLGKRYYNDGSNYSGCRALKNHWAKRGIDTKGMYIYDGSGLSRYNAVTPKQFVDVLKYMNKSKQQKSFYNTLPIAGKSGTLSSMLKGTKAYNNLRAKSGTISRVKCYTGYVKASNGHNLAFAIMFNNFNGSSYQCRKQIEKIMVAMAEYR